MKDLFEGKVILITGGTGSIGSEIARQLLEYNPKQIRILSRDESRQYELRERLNSPVNLRMLIGDIRDKERIEYAFKGVDIVFHAAALKHVPFCEYNPFEAIKTNIIGSQNIIEAAIKNNVKKVIAISTDKAVFPSNIMGVTKLLMEKLFINANYYTGGVQTKFSCVRFGNVAWARGSVLPLWKKQVETEKSIKVTNGEMTRFLMTKEQAVGLVFKAAKNSVSGEIFVLKMPSIKVSDLANIFLEKYYSGQDIKIEIVGSRRGDKMHEELIDEADKLSRVMENDEMYIFIPEMNTDTPKFTEKSEYFGFHEVNSVEGFSSKDRIDIEKIRQII